MRMKLSIYLLIHPKLSSCLIYKVTVDLTTYCNIASLPLYKYQVVSGVTPKFPVLYELI